MTDQTIMSEPNANDLSFEQWTSDIEAQIAKAFALPHELLSAGPRLTPSKPLSPEQAEQLKRRWEQGQAAKLTLGDNG